MLSQQPLLSLLADVCGSLVLRLPAGAGVVTFAIAVSFVTAFVIMGVWVSAYFLDDRSSSAWQIKVRPHCARCCRVRLCGCLCDSAPHDYRAWCTDISVDGMAVDDSAADAPCDCAAQSADV